MEPHVRMDQIDLTSEMRRIRLEPRPNEQAFEIIPKHFGRMFLPGLLLFAFTIIFITTLLSMANTLAGPSLYVTITVVLGLVYFLAVVYALSQWYCFRQSALIFTNQRVINVDYRNIFTRLVQEIDIHAILNARGETPTPAGKFFNFGDLVIDRIGSEPFTFFYIPYPHVTAEQTMHFHNVVVHAGVEPAHNYLARSLGEDTTPELEETMQKAEASVMQPTEPNVDTPVAARGLKTNPENSRKRLNFEAPSDRVGELLKGLHAQEEPRVSYLPPLDVFEIEAMVLEDELQPTVETLRREGARKIETE